MDHLLSPRTPPFLSAHDKQELSGRRGIEVLCIGFLKGSWASCSSSHLPAVKKEPSNFETVRSPGSLRIRHLLESKVSEPQDHGPQSRAAASVGREMGLVPSGYITPSASSDVSPCWLELCL